MTTPYQIPLSPKAQSFFIQLGAVSYLLTFRWNSVSAAWMLDIASADRVPLVSSIPVITGLDLLAPHKHLGFTGALIAQTDNDPDVVPTFTNLGTGGRLYYVA